MVIRTKGKDKSSVTLLQLKGTGLLDGWVIKQYKDKIVLACPPAKKKKQKFTKEQIGQQNKMTLAVEFAKRIIYNPVEKAKWKKRAKGFSNVYQAALSWYLKHPR